MTTSREPAGSQARRPPDRLVQAAAEAMLRTRAPQLTDAQVAEMIGAGAYVDDARIALTAAFAALPIDELREQARESAAATGSAKNVYLNGVYKMADAASDVWVAALARELGEQ